MNTNSIFYIAIAYRWGCSNEHQYIVGSLDSLEELDRIAVLECQNRGGKYGIAIYQIDNSISDNMSNLYHTLVRYHSSLYGEDKPIKDFEIESAKEIGQQIIRAFKGHSIYLSTNENDTKLELTTVVLPEWLMNLCKSILEEKEHISNIINNKE